MASTTEGRSCYLLLIWRLRFFWLSLACNDIAYRYRRSLLGLGWSLLRPLAMTIVFCTVFGTLFNQLALEYAPYLMLGLAVWQFINESIMAGAMCFMNSASYIRQQSVPLAIFSLRVVLGSGFHFLIGLILAVAVTIYCQGMPTALGVLALLPGLILLFIFCWAAATIVGLAQTHFRDASHLLEIGMQILFYLTPIVYKTENFPRTRGLHLVLEWNPLASLLQCVRQPVLHGSLPATGNFLVAVVFVTLTVLLARASLRKLERTLVFWL